MLGAALLPCLQNAWAQNAPLPPALSEQQPANAQPRPLPELNGAAKYQGELVRDIQFKGIAGTNAEMLRGLLLVKAGDVLDRDALRESIRVLYATGRFSSLHVEASPEKGGGVTLTFVTTENYFNGDVSVEGLNKKTPPKPHQVVNASKLELGELFSEENVKLSIDRMKKVHGRQRILPGVDHLRPDAAREHPPDGRAVSCDTGRPGSCGSGEDRGRYGHCCRSKSGRSPS